MDRAMDAATHGPAEPGGGTVRWDGGSAPWRSATGTPPPHRVLVVDDALDADTAFRHATQGTALLWRGDFHNARNLLSALARRLDRRARPPKDFHVFRQARAQRARTLGRILVPIEAGHAIALRRAPDVADALDDALGPADEPYVLALRELLGAVGAHEWRVKGVHVPALDARVHPRHGVFAPVRGEYVDLVAAAPLPAGAKTAFDLGTGTGVLAAVLARRGVPRIVATDADPRALDCAREDLTRLGVDADVVAADPYPDGRADLVVCNPPWLPGKPATPLEHAIYDRDSGMLRAFLTGLTSHLEPGGEGWLILSDLAEHLGLRTRDDLESMIAAAGLTVLDRVDARPRHPRAADPGDPLHAARSAEVTSLWRLAHA